jgi:hypothetical protein
MRTLRLLSIILLATLLVLGSLHPYALLAVVLGGLIGLALAGRASAWIAAILAPLGVTWGFLAAISSRYDLFGMSTLNLAIAYLWLAALAWFGAFVVTFIVLLVRKRASVILVLLLAVAVQGLAAWHVARVSMLHPLGNYISRRFVTVATFVTSRQSARPGMPTYRLKYEGDGNVMRVANRIDKVFLTETVVLDAAAVKPLSAYIVEFQGEVRCKDILDCVKPSAFDGGDEVLRRTAAIRPDGSVIIHQSREAILTRREIVQRDLVPPFLYRWSAVTTPAFVPLPEDTVYANFLTPGPTSKLRLSVPINRVASTEPPIRAARIRGDQEQLDFVVGFPQPVRASSIDHMFAISSGVYLTFAKPAFARPRWIAILRFISSSSGLWLLIAGAGIAAFIGGRTRVPRVVSERG